MFNPKRIGKIAQLATAAENVATALQQFKLATARFKREGGSMKGIRIPVPTVASPAQWLAAVESIRRAERLLLEEAHQLWVERRSQVTPKDVVE